MTTRQLVGFAAAVIVLTLALAWLIERRQVLSLREELHAWGAAPDLPPVADVVPPAPPEGADGQIVGWPEEPETGGIEPQ